jgi:hypothetical protein
VAMFGIFLIAPNNYAISAKSLMISKLSIIFKVENCELINFSVYGKL